MTKIKAASVTALLIVLVLSCIGVICTIPPVMLIDGLVGIVSFVTILLVADFLYFILLGMDNG